MRVLITGGAGYLGGALTDILQTSAHEVLVYDALLFEEAYMKPLGFVRGDVRDKRKLKKYLAWADAVVWLAAIVGDGACALNPGATNEINKDSVRWLADNYDQRIIFMSTCSVYGARDGVLDESSPTNPLSLYASTKLEAEGCLKDKNALVFRLGTLFGLSDLFSRIRLDLVVNTLTARAISEGKLKVFGGDQYRPLLHVRDAAQTIADNLETEHTGIYNLCQSNMRILDLAKLVEQYVPVEIDIVETTFEDSRNYRASSKKAMQALGFRPAFTPEDGITELRQLLIEERIGNLDNIRYTNVGHLGRLWSS